MLTYLVLQGFVLQAGVPLGLCIMCWPHGYSMQVEKNAADSEESKSRREAAVEERGKMHLEAGNALLICFESTAGRLLPGISSLSQGQSVILCLLREILV